MRYQTFTEKAVLDAEVRRVKFVNSSNGEVIIEIPHFWNSASKSILYKYFKILYKTKLFIAIDPNYAALLRIDPMDEDSVETTNTSGGTDHDDNDDDHHHSHKSKNKVHIHK